MATTLNLAGLDKRLQQIQSLKNLDPQPLLVRWQDIMEMDNRRGVLAGLDRYGAPMVPVTYRPKPPAPPKGYRVNKPPAGKGTKSIKAALKQFRLGQRASMKQGVFAGLGPHVSGMHNNLSTAEYQLLGGPPLAPRDQFSRVITNFITRIGGPPLGDPQWMVEGVWDQIVDEKGRPFLLAHFEGHWPLPRRDLRGVRRWGIEKALEALRNWARTIFHEHLST